MGLDSKFMLIFLAPMTLVFVIRDTAVEPYMRRFAGVCLVLGVVIVLSQCIAAGPNSWCPTRHVVNSICQAQ
jgi:hypothetical protein